MKTPREQELPLVLVIDKEQEVLDSLAETLAAVNITCRCCTHPDEALAAATATPPNLILCDLNLFGETGPQTCERIRQQPGLEAVPIMFLSTAQMPDVIRRSHGASSTYCLRKPFTPGVLVGLIDATIGIPRSAARQAPEPAALATSAAPIT